jgi:hypothetical protein
VCLNPPTEFDASFSGEVHIKLISPRLYMASVVPRI